MIALIRLLAAVLASPFKWRSRLEAENAALRQQLNILRRKVGERARLTNTDRWFFVQLYRWFPSILQVLTIIQPETVALASGRLSSLLALEIKRPRRATAGSGGAAGAHTTNERREPAVGRAAHSRRTAEARV
jgi:hypothetical protein